MAFPLIFTIGLAVVLLSGAVFIGKSSLPPNEKLTSLVVIMALFALFSIVNEVKRSNAVKPVANIIKPLDIRKVFYKHPILSSNISFPLMDDPRDFVNSTLGDWDPSRHSNYQLAFLYADRKEETSLAFKEYTRHLQDDRTPALYLELNVADYNLLDLASTLRIPSIESLDETVSKFNHEGKVPSIFIENIENAFKYDETLGNGFVCSLCKYLVSLYDNSNINVVFISNDPIARDYLRADSSYNNKIKFFNLKERSENEVQRYLTEKVNPSISDVNKQFDHENTKFLLKLLGWNPIIIEEYLQSIESYEDVKDFAESKLEQQAQRVSGFQNIWDILSTLIGLTQDKKDNSWISYGQIRKFYQENPIKKLEDAINAHLLLREKNLYRFRNVTLYNALLTAKGISIE